MRVAWVAQDRRGRECRGVIRARTLRAAERILADRPIAGVRVTPIDGTEHEDEPVLEPGRWWPSVSFFMGVPILYASVRLALEALALHDDALAVGHGRVARELLASGVEDRWLRYSLSRAGWDDLLRDLERREREGARPPLPDLEHASIAALIAQLDELDGPPSSRSSRTVILRHPLGRALVARGQDAIEPLLEAFVHDLRVTRIVRTPDAVVTVSYAALNLVYAIAGLAPAEPGLPIADLVDQVLAGGSSLEETAQRVRTFLAQRGSLPPAERWYLALRDGEDFEGASRMITRPRELARASSDTRPDDDDVEPKSEGLAGEALRDARLPSVSDLLAAHAVREGREPDCVAMERLLRWDPVRARDAARGSHCLAAARSRGETHRVDPRGAPGPV